MTTQTRKLLLPQHRKLLEESGVSESRISERGYYSETVRTELARLGFSPAQRVVPALVIPIWSYGDRPSLHQIRPDHPRYLRGKPVKYETPVGTALQIDIPPKVREEVLNGVEPLFITVGVRKADSAVSCGLACVAVLGVYGWKQDGEFWRRVTLKGRTVYIAFDSDIASNVQVRRAAASLFAFLESLGAKPCVIRFPPNGNQKTGLDDFLAAGGTVDELLRLATAEAPSFRGRSAEFRGPEYEADENGIVKIIESDDGPVKRQLTNFSAQIIAETVYGRTNEPIRELDIDAFVRGRKHLITVTADEFDRMSWAIPRLGADAIIFPSYGAKDEVRAAIQVLSSNIKKLTGIDRLGWHQVDGEHIFVHAGGFIRGRKQGEDDSDLRNRPAASTKPGKDLGLPEPAGTISPAAEDVLGVRMRIPNSLHRYRLPHPSQGSGLVRDIKASLRLLALAPFQISVPVYSAIWYSAIEDADFSIHLYGSTGSFKTEYAALVAQHFGAGLDARHLPASWMSTPNYIRAMAAHAGNVILPVDDFVPTGSQFDIDRTYRAAEDVFRSQGNAAGRGRCYRDGTPQEPTPPRCLILSTGEVRPSGHSLTSRVLMLEVNPGDILDRGDESKKAFVTAAQRTAKSGAYARVMAAFIQWIAADFENQRKIIKEQAQSLRGIFAQECQHARTVDTAAKLLAGFDRFLDFVTEVGAMDEDLFESIWRMAHEALFEVLANQERDQADEDPVHRFLDLLRTALATGRAHLSYLLSLSEGDDNYGSPVYFGYQERRIPVSTPLPIGELGGAEKDSTAEKLPSDTLEYKNIFTPTGSRIGWKQYDNLYLEPKESLAVVQRLAKDMNQPPIPLNYKALGKRLSEHGLLASRKKDRNLARVNIQGRKEDVFHLRLSDFMELHRCDGDFVDERNEEEFEEHERAAQRQQQAEKLRQARRDRVNEFRQQQFLRLLNPLEDV